MAMRARVKSPRLAHRDGLPWRGSSLEDVLFPHCAGSRGELRESNLVVRSCGAGNVWSAPGDSGLHYGAESQGSTPLCQKRGG